MSQKYPTDHLKFQALQDRDPNAEGEFIYCVLSTSIFCRPTCFSRLPLRKNIIFCDSTEEAINMKFRPCKRCKPGLVGGWDNSRSMVKEGCSIILQQARLRKKLNVEEIVSYLGFSKWHFCRMFKNYTEMTPRKFYLCCREGADPLRKKPLPLIQTKRNLAKMRKASKAVEIKNNALKRKDVGQIITPEMIFSDNDNDNEFLFTTNEALEGGWYSSTLDSCASELFDGTEDQNRLECGWIDNIPFNDKIYDLLSDFQVQ